MVDDIASEAADPSQPAAEAQAGRSRVVASILLGWNTVSDVIQQTSFASDITEVMRENVRAAGVAKGLREEMVEVGKVRDGSRAPHPLRGCNCAGNCGDGVGTACRKAWPRATLDHAPAARRSQPSLSSAGARGHPGRACGRAERGRGTLRRAHRAGGRSFHASQLLFIIPMINR
jgi:hypothetical protein